MGKRQWKGKAATPSFETWYFESWINHWVCIYYTSLGVAKTSWCVPNFLDVPLHHSLRWSPRQAPMLPGFGHSKIIRSPVTNYHLRQKPANVFGHQLELQTHLDFSPGVWYCFGRLGWSLHGRLGKLSKDHHIYARGPVTKWVLLALIFIHAPLFLDTHPHISLKYTIRCTLP